MKKYTPMLCFAVVLTFSQCAKDEQVANENPIHTFNIDVEPPVPINEKKAMLFQEVAPAEKEILMGGIERRGGFSISLPKHSYEIDLPYDVPLLGLPSDDDWILNANYIDKTFLRHIISYELFAEMNANNETAQCKYVKLQLNNIYNGLYVLMEKLDKSSLEVDGDDTQAVIFKEPNVFRQSYDGIIIIDGNNNHKQTYPKFEEDDRNYLLEEVREFILMSSDEVFEEEVETVFDIDNMIDWHLLLLVTNNSDGILKNFYLYKVNSNTPMRVAPWDYDHSFGRDGDNELNMNENVADLERSILFERLLTFESYRQRLKTRWEELNDNGLLSEAGLEKRIIEKSNIVREYTQENFELWPVTGTSYYDDNDFEQEIGIMLEFVTLRHQYLRDYFDAF